MNSGEIHTFGVEKSVLFGIVWVMKSYLPRVADSLVEQALRSSGAVEIRGTRACGKTETARQFAASEIRLDAGDARAALAATQPETALSGDTPRLIDEWQLVQGIWNAVRREVDERRRPGQFLLTGSAAPEDDPFRHSGAGRFKRVLLRTMSFFESGHSSGQVGLGSLFKDQSVPIAESQLGFGEVVNRIVSGGWPGWLGLEASDAQAQAGSYLDDIAEHDFPDVAGMRRDPRRFRAYLNALAGLVAQPASFSAINRRMQDEFSASVSATAAGELHDFASRMYLVEDQPAWSPKLRSKTTAAQAPVRHLADPSLAAALLNAGTERLLLDLNTLGFLFESQVIHDLRVYAQAAGARGVFHFRDTKGRDEIDAVVENADGRWIGFEVKLGEENVDAAAANLLRVSAKIARQPSALVVITPTGVSYRRSDGVLVVPLTVLGP